MAKFTIKIAGCAARVHSLFESTWDYCRNYLTEEQPELTVEVTREDLLFEQAELDREAREEGLRLRKFSEPFLERAAVQRKIAEFLFNRDVLLLHGSTVAVDGEAYLFTAKCGTGKSTHTRLWREVFPDRAVMVNDDKPFLRITPEGVLACGAPWSGKHGLDTNITVPLKGICILERGSENCICRMDAAEVMEMLLHQGYRPLDPAKEGRYQELVAQLAEKTPLWHMTCTKAPEAARIAHGAMSAPENPDRSAGE